VSLQIQMLGTGSAFAKAHYNNNALVYSNGYTLMIDCGYTAPRSLFDLNIPFDRIDAILISHIHADHIGGLEEFAFQLQYVYKKKTKLIVPSAIIHSLWENALKGGLYNAAENMTDLSSYFQVMTVNEGTPVKLHDGLVVEILRTEHIPGKPSYSFIINDHLFYSADAKFSLPLLTYLYRQRKCKYFLHDCQLFSPGTVHASLDELLTLPEEIQEKVLLMHYGDNYREFIGKTGRMRFMEQHRKYDFVT
jgi:ribonuclease BN (tRNA processing enzyme)